MKTGFLLLETSPEHNGMVRVKTADRMPLLANQEEEVKIRYVARFKDIEAAQMHVQNMMHSALEDVEYRIYRKSLDEMIACVEADELEHTRVWIDPDINTDELGHIESLVDRNKRRNHLIDLVWQAVGIVALLFLLITGLTF